MLVLRRSSSQQRDSRVAARPAPASVPDDEPTEVTPRAPMSDPVSDFLGSGIARALTAARAVDSCDIVLVLTDLDGKVLLSEGGALAGIGLSPGLAVGHSIREWPEIPFDQALQALQAGKRYTSVTRGRAPVGVDDETRARWEAPWVSSFGLARSASGAVTGVVYLSMPLVDVHGEAVFDTCPMGSCFLRDPGKF